MFGNTYYKYHKFIYFISYSLIFLKEKKVKWNLKKYSSVGIKTQKNREPIKQWEDWKKSNQEVNLWMFYNFEMVTIKSEQNIKAGWTEP